MRSSQYDDYKPSGIGWIGEIPNGWEVKRLKYTVSANDNVLAEDTPPDWEILYVDIGNVDQVSGITRKDAMRFEDAPSRARRLVHHGDTIVSTVRTYLKAIAPIENPESNLVVSTGFAVIRPRAMDSTFLAFCLRSSYFVETVVSRSTGVSYPATNPGEILTIQLAYPKDPIEQQEIASFLERETSRVDLLLGKKRDLIERLKEKRSALISRTVTCGLPPEAAGAAGMPESFRRKPSGIDWIGDIPAHWDVRKFSREVGIAEGQVNPEIEPYAKMLLIGPEHVQSGTGSLIKRETAMEQGAESGKYYCQQGDIVYSKIRPALRKLVIAPEDCLCSADMYPLRGRSRLRNNFIFWLFLSQQFAAWSVLESDRVAMPKINRDTLNELRMPVPPIPEQDEIAKFLSAETAKLDVMTTKVETAIERLQEYRAALINAAVTGKIDVRKAIA